MKMVQDHQGKTSQARVASLLCTGVACILAVAPIFTKVPTDIYVMSMLLGVPNGLTLWQKLAVTQEQK